MYKITSKHPWANSEEHIKKKPKSRSSIVRTSHLSSPTRNQINEEPKPRSQVSLCCVCESLFFYKYVSSHSNFSITQKYLPDAHVSKLINYIISNLCCETHQRQKVHGNQESEEWQFKGTITLFKIKIFERISPPLFFFYFPDIELSILDSLLYFSQQTYDKNVT